MTNILLKLDNVLVDVTRLFMKCTALPVLAFVMYARSDGVVH